MNLVYTMNGAFFLLSHQSQLATEYIFSKHFDPTKSGPNLSFFDDMFCLLNLWILNISVVKTLVFFRCTKRVWQWFKLILKNSRSPPFLEITCFEPIQKNGDDHELFKVHLNQYQTLVFFHRKNSVQQLLWWCNDVVLLCTNWKVNFQFKSSP